MALHQVSPSSANGQNRRIELPGIDLWILARTDVTFVYPAEINLDRFKDALGRTLSIWSVVAGRFLIVDGHRYVIELCDNPIPVTVVENTELSAWPTGMNVVSELHRNPLDPFMDGVDVVKLLPGSADEPLVRFKLTRLVQSDEWVLGVSWAHLLGDAAALLDFLSTISRLYQQLEPLGPAPVFERRLWREDEANDSFLPLMKHLTHAGPLQDMFQSFSAWQDTHEQVNIHFSAEHLSKLRALAGGDKVTIQDSLSAYLIATLNKHCYADDPQRRILRANTTISCRGVSDAIAPVGHVSNAIVQMLSEDFDDPLSLPSIASTIRRSIVRSRDPKLLEGWLATADGLLRKITREYLLANWNQFPNEAIVNSNYRYDWAKLVDFGYTDQCRYFTAWTGPCYFRVFRLNPEKDGTRWLPRDQTGAEVAFLIEKDMKDRFLRAWQTDVSACQS